MRLTIKKMKALNEGLSPLHTQPVVKQFNLSEEDRPEEIEIEKPNQPEHGDAATNLAMTLAPPSARQSPENCPTDRRTARV
ncbi:MAG: hypothetical protein U5K69_27235 [Balneolaceae bacterium]|nr:hypothetical protein [Balneolaceae bacterium]